jgi:hypothetical protein
VRLLDFPFSHADPDAFATRREILDFISAYADFIAPPIANRRHPDAPSRHRSAGTAT